MHDGNNTDPLAASPKDPRVRHVKHPGSRRVARVLSGVIAWYGCDGNAVSVLSTVPRRVISKGLPWEPGSYGVSWCRDSGSGTLVKQSATGRRPGAGVT